MDVRFAECAPPAPRLEDPGLDMGIDFRFSPPPGRGEGVTADGRFEDLDPGMGFDLLLPLVITPSGAMRGEWVASDIRFAGPGLSTGIDARFSPPAPNGTMRGETEPAEMPTMLFLGMSPQPPAINSHHHDSTPHAVKSEYPKEFH
jgi:hypothetical protein